MDKGFHRLQRLIKFHWATEKMSEIRQHIKKAFNKRKLEESVCKEHQTKWVLSLKVQNSNWAEARPRFVILLQIMYLRGNSFLSIFLAFYIQHKVTYKSPVEWERVDDNTVSREIFKQSRKSYSKQVFRQMTLYVKQNLGTLWTCRNFTPGISIRKDFQLFSTTVQLWFDEWSKCRMAVIAKGKLCAG